MFYSPRKIFMEDVIAVPAEATTSSAVISSDVLKPFEESSFGQATLFIKGDNTKMSIADAFVSAMVSYDEGETWVEAATVTVAEAAFVFTVQSVAGLVPRLKLSLDLSGMTLAEDHGLQVDVLFEERADNGSVTLYPDAVDVPTTVADDVTTAGSTLSVGEYTDEVFVVVTSDSSKLTDTTLLLQSSWDGMNWWDLGTATDISAADFVEFSEANDVVGTYVRANVITALTTGAITADHGIAVNLFARRQA